MCARYEIQTQAWVRYLVSSLYIIVHICPRWFQFSFDTCVPLAFSFQHWGVLARQALSYSAASPGPLMTCWLWAHFPPGESRLPFLAPILKGRVCIPEAYTPQPLRYWKQMAYSMLWDMGIKFKKKKNKVLSRFWNAVLLWWEQRTQSGPLKEGFFFFVTLATALV